MRVALGLSFFDKIKELPLCLGDPADPTAVCNNVDFIIGIDGRYQGYDSDHNYSNDGSYEFVKQYENAIVERYWGYQPDKRQRYLDIAGELKCTHLIVIDSDEFLHPDYRYRDWIKFYENLARFERIDQGYNIFRMNLFIEQGYRKAYNVNQRGRFRSYARVHIKPGEQRYAFGCHYRWCNKDTTDAELANRPHLEYLCSPNVVRGVALTTTSDHRDEATLKTRDKWAWNTMKEENRRLCVIMDNHVFHHGNLKYPDLETFYTYDKEGKINGKSY